MLEVLTMDKANHETCFRLSFEQVWAVTAQLKVNTSMNSVIVSACSDHFWRSQSSVSGIRQLLSCLGIGFALA